MFGRGKKEVVADEGTMLQDAIAQGWVTHGLNPEIFSDSTSFQPSSSPVPDAAGAYIAPLARHGELLLYREGENAPFNLVGGIREPGEMGLADTAVREAHEEIKGVDWGNQPLDPLGVLNVRGANLNVYCTKLSSDQCRAIGTAMLDPEAPERGRRFEFLIRGLQEAIAQNFGGAFASLYEAISSRRTTSY